MLDYGEVHYVELISIGYFLPPGGWGSGVVALPGVPCARWPWLVGVSQPASSLVCWLDGGLVGSTGRPTHLCVDRLVNSSESNPLALPVCLPLGVEILVKSVAYTATRYGGLRSRSTASSRTRELQRSCCDSSRFPSARVRFRRSRLNYWPLLGTASTLTLSERSLAVTPLALVFAGRLEARRARSWARGSRSRSRVRSPSPDRSWSKLRSWRPGILFSALFMLFHSLFWSRR